MRGLPGKKQSIYKSLKSRSSLQNLTKTWPSLHEVLWLTVVNGSEIRKNHHTGFGAPFLLRAGFDHIFCCVLNWLS